MNQQTEHKDHPTVTEHPEQRRQEETGQEDASDATEVGRPPSQTSNPAEQEHAA